MRAAQGRSSPPESVGAADVLQVGLDLWWAVRSRFEKGELYRKHAVSVAVGKG